MNPRLLLILVVLVSGFTVCAQPKEALALEANLKEVISRCSAASVLVSGYDSIRARPNGSTASGVLVSEDGLVLTAGHVSYPNRMYQIDFPDGKQVLARGLGRIARLDLGLMKIMDKGVYPFVEMGWSSSIQENEPCISIAYPGSFNERKSVVRFGYVSGLEVGRRLMMRTSCLMEPGDSGGPTFDLLGRVIGVHSNIQLALEDNFEVPIDHFRKYWTALQQPISYTELPKEDFMPNDMDAGSIPLVDAKKVMGLVSKEEEQLDQYCIQLNSLIDSDTAIALGTLVDLGAFDPGAPALKKYTYIISKSSLVGDAPVVLVKGKPRAVKLVFRDTKKDLVLLQLDQKSKTAIQLKPGKVTDTIPVGTILLSPNPQNEGETSVAGTGVFDLPAMSGSGYLGVRIETNDGKNVVAMVQPNSAASSANLALGDEILSVNGVEIDDPATFTREIRKKMPRESVLLVRSRQNNIDTLNIVLGRRPANTAGLHIGERFTDGKSERRDGFGPVFVHDGKLKPEECGGPIFDLNKKFVGINMARYSRTSSIGLPLPELLAFIDEAIRGVKKI